MEDFDLLRFICKGIRLDAVLGATLDNAKKVTAWYQLLYLGETIEPWIVFWHALTSAIDAEDLREMGQRFAMTESEKARLVEEHIAVPNLLNSLIRFWGTNYELYNLLVPYSTETILHVMALSENEKVRRIISLFFTKLKGTECILRGRDLIEMGIQAGPAFKKILDRLLEAKLNEEVRTREEEVDLVNRELRNLK
jgi:tRNA nucleotidyltransferase (CCA-adding enzyme)